MSEIINNVINHIVFTGFVLIIGCYLVGCYLVRYISIKIKRRGKARYKAFLKESRKRLPYKSYEQVIAENANRAMHQAASFGDLEVLRFYHAAFGGDDFDGVIRDAFYNKKFDIIGWAIEEKERRGDYKCKK